jgi:hypothetical protein
MVVVPPEVVVAELPPQPASSPINTTNMAPRAYILSFTFFLLEIPMKYRNGRKLVQVGQRNCEKELLQLLKKCVRNYGY